MSKLIVAGKLVSTDPWLEIRGPDNLVTEYALAPMSLWQSHLAVLINAKHRGVIIGVDQELEDMLTTVLPYVELIVVHFEKFSDGRGFSLAHLLRSRYHYTGELRATGSIIPDTVFYLKRCGFDAFDLPTENEASVALDALTTFSQPYQGGCDTLTHPLFKRQARN